MVFSSNSFVFIFFVFAAFYYCVRNKNIKNITIVLGSFAFLWYAGFGHVVIIAGVILSAIAYICLAGRSNRSRNLLWVLIVFLILNLAYFKYRGFFSDIVGVTIPIPVYLSTIIPLGISFYTLQIIGALYDKRNDYKSVKPWRFLEFAVFFPQLIAGPICKYRSLAPQFSETRKFSLRNIFIGSQLFVVGYIKKVALADPISALIDPIWQDPSRFSGAAILIAVIGFALQVYCDFSGYTDMGRGAARILGFRLPINFRGPYFSASPVEFWSRWHMTLSGWIRYYLFNALSIRVGRLVRNRKLQKLAYLGVLLFVMAVIGLWHGAAFQFIVFGLIQGAFIGCWYFLFGQGHIKGLYKRIAGIIVTQSILVLSFVVFRSDGYDGACQIFSGLIRWQDGVSIERAYPGMALAFLTVFCFQSIEYYSNQRAIAKRLIAFRKSPAAFVVLSGVFYAIFFFKGMAIEGIWYPRHGGDFLENFIYFNF
jgi:alginate O-acetyltransferase complex protein AlgI